MTVAVESSGSQTAVISTEHTLASPSTAATRQLVVDIANMASGDVLELRVKRKARSGDTERIVYYGRFVDAPSVEDELKISIPVASPIGCTFTLKQTAGTGRAYPWSVETL